MTSKNKKIILPHAFHIVLALCGPAQPVSDVSGILLAKSGTDDNSGEAYYTLIQNGESLRQIVNEW